jgi:hypothetical protein
MLSPSAVFRKTEAGVAEISARALGLRAVVRRILIMVDGRNTVAGLTATVRADEIEAIIYELQSLSLIDMAGGVDFAVDLRATPSLAAVSVPPVPTTESLAAQPVEPSADLPAEPSSMSADIVVKLDNIPYETNAYVAEPTIAQFVGARQAAVRSLNDILGPRSETFVVRIEKCRTANELREQVTLIRQSLTNLVNENAAARFVEAVREGARI